MPSPPPVTPSPHRFAARRDQNKALLQPNSRFAAALAPTPSSRAPAPAKHDAVTPSQQFKPTPRFAPSSSRPTFSSPSSSTPQPPHADTLSQAARTTNDTETHNFFRRPRPKLSKVESIHDSSQEDPQEQTGQDDNDEEEMLYDAVAEEDAFLVERPNNEDPTRQAEQSTPLPEAILVPSATTEEQASKRRRLTTRPDRAPERSTPIRTMGPVNMDRSAPQSGKVPRFRDAGHSPARPTATATELASTQQGGSRLRNPFLLRSIGPDAAGSASGTGTTPLPEYFSPHRRSQKFLPGGIADVVRTWLLCVGQTGFQADATSSQSGQRLDRTQRVSQPSQIRVTGSVEERPGDRLKIISGQTITRSRPSLAQGDEGSSAQAILVGSAKGNSRSPNVGDDVTITSPSWKVEVGQHGETWLVAVDWRVT